MKYLIAVFILIIGVCIATSCGRGCLEAQYNFNMQEVFSPEKDSILVGDTVFMESSHSTSFKDTLTTMLIEFGGSQIGVNLGLLRFPDTSATPDGGMNDFSILVFKGKAVGNDNIPTQNKGFLFAEDGGNYELKIGFVAKQKGVYAISLGNSMGIIKKRSGCEKANILITNANTNNHLYYYQNWRPSYVIPDYEKKHLYCFKVK